MIIAIDGPAGSGKSTVAKLVAQALNFSYLDTGAMYRAVAYRALVDEIDLTEPLSEQSISAITAIAENEQISFGPIEGATLSAKVFINGIDVSSEIRTAETDKAVSPVSAEPGVRLALTYQQRQFGYANDTVMEGRDIGTVVFPDAELKLFLTASPEERAHRRATQNAEKEGRAFNENEFLATLADIIRRDEYDSNRQVSPLLAAADSIELDTTDLTIEEVVARIVELAKVRAK